MRTIILALILFTISGVQGWANSDSKKVDVTTIDGIVNSTLDLITMEKGGILDKELFKSLFLPSARFTVVNHTKENGTVSRTFTVDEFMELSAGAYNENGFTEYEIGKVVNEYNGIATVFQSYYAKQGDHEEKGINSYQLVYEDDRWWIANIVWTSNRNGAALPKKYTKKK